ncbi:hypothetical protein HYT25_00225, partial [Candidatus Pacearchaeota archaeon]|nr:hypothetical protein [Candidatus Pacearchaeota archaeon]
MAYKKYIKRDGKVFGPYVYHSRKINGRVITEYRGKHRKNFLDYLILVSVPVLLLLSIGLIFLLNPNYFESAKNIAFNSVNSITGLVTEEPVSEPEQMTETIPETIPEEIPQEEILPETPAEIVNEIQNETEIIEEINETVSEEIVENQTVSNDTIINETIETEENITETIPEQNITPETIINETETIEILNETLANITEQNITNETLINETIINITQENLTINTIQFQAVLNQPVKWKKEIISKDLGNVTIILPEISENVVVKKIKDNVEEEITSNSAITGAVIGGNENFIFRFLNNIIGRLTGKVVDETPVENAAEIEVEVEIDDENANYEIEYETPAPTSVEEEIQNGKRILVSGPEEVHYTDVLAFANLSENLQIKNPSKVKIKWIENDSYIVPISVEDKDNNGIYDYVEWIAPSLSEQTFEIILVSKAEHLDENKNFISDIYEQVKELDGIWSEEIPDTHYVRVTFEKNLTNENDITIYPR